MTLSRPAVAGSSLGYTIGAPVSGFRATNRRPGSDVLAEAVLGVFITSRWMPSAYVMCDSFVANDLSGRVVRQRGDAPPCRAYGVGCMV